MTTNVLGAQAFPRFFARRVPRGFAPPTPRLDVSVRTAARSLAGMQKEALVVSNAAPATCWRLVSDEGPYLDGHDEAPFPLAFLSAGMAASYATELLAIAERDKAEIADGLTLTVHNRYTMEGSALRGTMVGGALPPQVHVDVPGQDPVPLRKLATRALETSPLHGLLADAHTSRFTLTYDGEQHALKRVAALQVAPEVDPADLFADAVDDRIDDGTDDAAPLVRRVRTAEQREGEGGRGSSLQPSQRRTLHVEATCTLRSDGVKSVEVALHRPLGSTFVFLSDEPTDGRPARAPDAATLVSVGIAFCFMTQFGRYASITRQELGGYRIVQDLHLSASGARPGNDAAPTTGRAQAVETHVHLDAADSLGFARTVVDMGEQTCFLHALCRTPLEPALTIGREA